MKKSKLLKPALVFTVLLFFGSWTKTHAQGRSITPEELKHYLQVNPDYKEKVTQDANGIYTDNNTKETRNAAIVKWTAMENHEIITPALEKERVEKLNSLDMKLPSLEITGKEEIDIAMYKSKMTEWEKKNPESVQYLDANLRDAIKTQNYPLLYKYQYKAQNGESIKSK